MVGLLRGLSSALDAVVATLAEVVLSVRNWDKALPAIDFAVLLALPLLRTFDALVPTRVLVLSPLLTSFSR